MRLHRIIIFSILMVCFITTVDVGDSSNRIERVTSYEVKELNYDEWVLRYIETRCVEEKLPINVVHNVIQRESRWNFARKGEVIGTVKVKSPTNDYGLMQLQLRTAREVLGDSTITGTRLMSDHILNAEAGIRYLSYLSKLFDGNLEFALTAYNRGPAKVSNTLAIGGNPVTEYAKSVLNSK